MHSDLSFWKAVSALFFLISVIATLYIIQLMDQRHKLDIENEELRFELYRKDLR